LPFRRLIFIFTAKSPAPAANSATLRSARRLSSSSPAVLRAFRVFSNGLTIAWIGLAAKARLPWLDLLPSGVGEVWEAWVAALFRECYDLGFHEPRNSQPAPCGNPLANV
jgi:hypothetical protein